MSDKLKTAGIVSLAAVFFIFDRTGKWLFINIWHRAEFPLFGDWLKFKLAVNQGIAFGWPLDTGLIIFLTVLALIFLVYLAWQNYQSRNTFSLFCLSLAIAGAYSNLLDRVIYRGVIDYIDAGYLSIFNLADVLITLGVAGLIWSYWQSSKKHADDLKQSGI